MEQRVVFDAAAGIQIEGSLATVEQPRGALVVCHPHPLYGGDMDNPVVITATNVAHQLGLATLRFNFRGVGASSGTHDDGRGERDDAAAALAYLRHRVPEGTPFGIAGYSFGAVVSAAAAERERGLSALCVIAPPVARLAFPLPSTDLEVTVIAGTRDEYCPASELEKFAARLPAHAVTRIDGADHFFSGNLPPVADAIRGWVLRWAGA